MANGHIFYFIGYGLVVSGFGVRFQFGAGNYFLLRNSRVTVTSIQLPVQYMFESRGLDMNGQDCKVYRSPRSTLADKKEYYLIQH